MFDAADFEEPPVLVIGEPAAPERSDAPTPPSLPVHPQAPSHDISALANSVHQLAGAVAAQRREPPPPAPPIQLPQRVDPTAAVFDDPANLAEWVSREAARITDERLLAYDHHRLQPLVGEVGAQLGATQGAAARSAQDAAASAFRSSFSVSDEELEAIRRVATSRVASDPRLSSDPNAIRQAMILAADEAGLLTRPKSASTMPPSGRSEGAVSEKKKVTLPPVLQAQAEKIKTQLGLKSLPLDAKDIRDLEFATGMRIEGAA